MSAAYPGDPPWMDLARREIGIKEVAGPGSHPRILEYLSMTRIAPKFHDDETPWCSAFVCFVMECSNIASTRSAAARSWLTWGESKGESERPPPVGCVVILERTSATNPHAAHVGLYAGMADDGNVWVLGGNQSNKVCLRIYSSSAVLDYRWPKLS